MNWILQKIILVVTTHQNFCVKVNELSALALHRAGFKKEFIVPGAEFISEALEFYWYFPNLSWNLTQIIMAVLKHIVYNHCQANFPEKIFFGTFNGCFFNGVEIWSRGPCSKTTLFKNSSKTVLATHF